MSFFYADLAMPVRHAPPLPQPNNAVFPGFVPMMRPMVPLKQEPVPQEFMSTAALWNLGDVCEGVDLFSYLSEPLMDGFGQDLSAMSSPLCSGPTSPASNFDPSPPMLPETMFESHVLSVPQFFAVAESEQEAADRVLTTTRSGRMVRQVRYTELTEVTALDIEPPSPRRRSGGANAPMSRRRSSTFMAVKRDTHNVSERFRRAELKTSLDELRALVPSVKDDSRVHTGTILQETIAYIRQLEAEDRDLQAQIAEQRAMLGVC